MASFPSRDFTNNRLFYSKNLKGFRENTNDAELVTLITEISTQVANDQIAIAASLSGTTETDLTTINGSAITNSTINSTTVGQTTPSSGSFTSLETSGSVLFNGGGGDATWNATNSSFSFPQNVQIGPFNFVGNQINSGGDISINSGGTINLTAPTITINGSFSLPALSSLGVDNLFLDGSTLTTINNQDLILSTPLGRSVIIPRAIQISGGSGSAINSTTIGGINPAEGTFTNVGISVGCMTFNGINTNNKILFPTSQSQAFRIGKSGFNFMEFNSVTDTITFNSDVIFATPLTFTTLDADILRTGSDLLLDSENNNILLQTSGAVGGSINIQTQGVGINSITLSSPTILNNASNTVTLNPLQTLNLGLNATTALNLGSSTSGSLTINSGSQIDLGSDSASGINIGSNIAGSLTINSGSQIDLGSDSASGINIGSNIAGSLTINSGSQIDFGSDSASGINIGSNIAGSIEIDSGGSVLINSMDNVIIDSGSDDICLGTNTSGNLKIGDMMVTGNIIVESRTDLLLFANVDLTIDSNSDVLIDAGQDLCIGTFTSNVKIGDPIETVKFLIDAGNICIGTQSDGNVKIGNSAITGNILLEAIDEIILESGDFIIVEATNGIDMNTPTLSINGICNTSEHFRVDGIQVVTNQQAAIADLAIAPVTTTGAGLGDKGDATSIDSRFDDVETKVNSILSVLRTHGLIDT
jgi:hypothetical protein